MNDRLFHQGNPGHLQQNSRNENRADQGPPACRGRKRDQKHAPPDEAFTEIIRMPRIGPEPLVHDTPLVRRVCLEAGQLQIARRFEEKSDPPNGKAQEIQKRESCRLWRELAPLQGEGDGPQENGLQDKDLEKTYQPEFLTALFPPAAITGREAKGRDIMAAGVEAEDASDLGDACSCLLAVQP